MKSSSRLPCLSSSWGHHASTSPHLSFAVSGMLLKEVQNQSGYFFRLLPCDIMDSPFQPYNPNCGQIRFKELRIDAKSAR